MQLTSTVKYRCPFLLTQSLKRNTVRLDNTSMGLRASFKMFSTEQGCQNQIWKSISVYSITQLLSTGYCHFQQSLWFSCILLLVQDTRFPLVSHLLQQLIINIPRYSRATCKVSWDSHCSVGKKVARSSTPFQGLDLLAKSSRLQL